MNDVACVKWLEDPHESQEVCPCGHFRAAHSFDICAICFVKPYGVRVEVDGAVGMVYIALAPSAPGCVTRTQDFGPVRIDFDAEGNVYGIEIERPLASAEMVDVPSYTLNAVDGNPTLTALS